jgi:hypothetical protein
MANLIKLLITGVLSVSASFTLGFAITRIPMVNKVV